MKRLISSIFIVVAVWMATASVSAQTLIKGAVPYFSAEEMPDMTKWLPEPPTFDSKAFQYDISQYEWGKSRRADAARSAMAISHASIDPVDICSHFNKALGIEITPENTPQIYRLLIDGMETANNITLKPKKQYQRTRPFTYFKEQTLVPDKEDVLRNNGSYPSGHTVIGTTAALLLSEINPEAANELIEIGYQYGQSRVIAGYHWQSDVNASRFATSVALAKMHTSKRFVKQLERAKREFKKLSR
ncbi:MAG: phosphatase PAP2 family protein [Alistipes sp.]|nr:phosphatase PAP2 family protein [Alistipes sp.]